MNRTHVLILSCDRLSQDSLYELLSRSNFKVHVADSITQSIAILEENTCRIILADLDHNSSGQELLKKIKKLGYPAEVIFLVSYGNMEKALKAMAMGAFAYLVKPVEDDKIILAVNSALVNKSSQDEKPSLLRKIRTKDHMFHGLVGTSSIMTEIYSLVDRISNSSATVIIRGKSGTGKRLIARAIHSADKKRRDKPFIEISCGALPRDIIESELFGHTKGSFTGAINDRKGRFELADGGTILLDDIDSFSLDLQVKLLRVLQHKEFERVGDHKTIKVDVRIVASTNQDLEKAVAEKRFREDLYYRVNVISINMPPLEKRKEDLTLLIDHFVSLYSKENHKKINGISEEAVGVLTGYNWPGNIRELENIIERAVILDTDGVIDNNDLPEIILGRTVVAASEPESIDANISESLKDALQEPEKLYILQVLKEVGGNKKKAAARLGVNRTTLYNKLKKYSIA